MGRRKVYYISSYYSYQVLFFFFFEYLFIWLCRVLIAAHGSFIVPFRIFTAACKLLVVACGIQFPDQVSNLGPLNWECGVLATRPPGRSLLPGSFFLMFQVSFNKIISFVFSFTYFLICYFLFSRLGKQVTMGIIIILLCIVCFMFAVQCQGFLYLISNIGAFIQTHSLYKRGDLRLQEYQ